MKKVNKALMATVAILLSLVLISTSVLSGVFAKFVETKSAGSTVSLKAFGITVTVSAPRGTSYATIDTNQTVNNGKNVSVTLKSLSMYPGRTAYGIVKFAFSGATTVKTKLTIRVDVQSNNKLLVTKNVFPDYLGSKRAYMPMGLRVETYEADGKCKNYGSTPYWENAGTIAALDTELEREHALDIAGAITSTNDSSNGSVVTGAAKDTSGTGSYSVTKTFEAGQPILLYKDRTAIGFGYQWAMDSDLVSYSDEISTYIAEQLNGASAVTAIYTVTLEQVS